MKNRAQMYLPQSKTQALIDKAIDKAIEAVNTAIENIALEFPSDGFARIDAFVKAHFESSLASANKVFDPADTIRLYRESRTREGAQGLSEEVTEILRAAINVARNEQIQSLLELRARMLGMYPNKIAQINEAINAWEEALKTHSR